MDRAFLPTYARLPALAGRTSSKISLAIPHLFCDDIITATSLSLSILPQQKHSYKEVHCSPTHSIDSRRRFILDPCPLRFSFIPTSLLAERRHTFTSIALIFNAQPCVPLSSPPAHQQHACTHSNRQEFLPSRLVRRTTSGWSYASRRFQLCRQRKCKLQGGHGCLLRQRCLRVSLFAATTPDRH